ncbi:putative 2OG-Fe(II) oxygenase [Alteromonas sp. ASW11-36]|uniref:2OG-Fe(II) oxygenase n=1 Tax=Alteromonas arenosi TaxID=3055817 RepID=A0ABT7SV50_9ALTE|nr:tetratricopeptide repeat protein [Alteromonas sp. ASW11-36]MDM7860068.1 putative 2OG-Fe(II) oxygenase [Alteromonas sp. ASW11-36]
MQNPITQQIIKLYQQRQYEWVIKQFESSLGVKQCDPQSGVCYANALRHSGNLSQANKVYRNLSKRFATVPFVLNGHANLLIAIGEFDNGINLLKKALQIDPKFLDGYINLARAYSLKKQFTLAEKSYRQALQTRPDDPQLLMGLASALQQNDKLGEAESIYQQLLIRLPSPWGIKLYLQYASLLRVKQNYRNAISLLEKAVQIEPNNVDVIINLAANHVLLQQHDAAIVFYEKAIAIAPLDASLQIEYAHVRWSLGIEEPFAKLMSAVRNTHASYELCIAALDLLLNAEQLDLTQVVIEAGVGKWQSDPTFMMFVARHHRLCNRLGEAQIAIRTAVTSSKGPPSVSIENERGYIALALGDGKTALNIYRKLQRRETDDQGWWTLYSTALKIEKAEREYHQLCDYDLVNVSSILSCKPAGFIPRLIDKLEHMHANSQHPIGQSLRGGTQTYEDIFDDPEPVIQELKTWIMERANAFTQAQAKNVQHPFLRHVGKALSFTGSWSVNLKVDGFHTSHFHPQGWLSGVFYVDIPPAVDAGGEGWLQFGKPEIDQLDLPADYVIKPESGTLVLFPSFMWHGTRPFTRGERRLTIAFDMVPAD